MRLAHRASAFPQCDRRWKQQPRAGVIRLAFVIRSALTSNYTYEPERGATGAAASRCLRRRPKHGRHGIKSEKSLLCRRGRQRVILEAVAQDGLLDLAGRGVRDFADEDDVVRHPPFGDLAVEE